MMMQDDFLILKGQGVFLHGHAADMFGNMRALAPFEVEDGVNAFHVNPNTKKYFRKEDGFDVRNQYQAMVEEILYQLMKDNPQLKGDVREQSKIRMDLRKKLNEAARNHNEHTGKNRWEAENPHAGPHTHRFPEKVFLDTNDTNSVNPALTPGVYAESYQKMAVEKGPDGKWYRGVKGDRVDPAYAQVKNQAGVYPDMQHSMVMHDDHGQMSESMFSVILGEYLHLVKHGSEDGSSSPMGYGHLLSKIPYTLSQGHVLPDALVIYEDPQTGRRSKVWNYRTTGKPGSLGRTASSRGVLGGMPGGMIPLHEALATIDPIFFQPVHRSASQDRKDFARKFMQGMTRRAIPEDVLNNFAMSPVCYALHEAKKGRSGGSATRSGTATNVLLRNVRRYAFGIPNSSEGFRNEEEKNRFKEAEHNIGEIGIESSILPGERGPFTAAIRSLKEMVYLSILLRTPGNERAANIVREGLPESEGVPGWASPGDTIGRTTRDYYRRHTNTLGRDYTDFQFVPHDEIPDQENRRAPWKESVPYAVHEGFTPPPGTPWGEEGLFGTSTDYTPPDNSLYSLMESLQSASARLDNQVMKSLPAHRRFDIQNSYDRNELCHSYEVEDRDLFYINETIGDWDMIAKELKVNPVVVKGIKVAFRW